MKQVPGSIGYIELVYAKQNKLPLRRREELLGQLCHAVDRVRHRGARDGRHPGRLPLLDGESARGPGLSDLGCTWLLVYAEQKDHAKGEKLVQFLKWAYSDGEKLAPASTTRPFRTRSSSAPLKRCRPSNIDVSKNRGRA